MPLNAIMHNRNTVARYARRNNVQRKETEWKKRIQISKVPACGPPLGNPVGVSSQLDSTADCFRSVSVGCERRTISNIAAILGSARDRWDRGSVRSGQVVCIR